MTDPTDWNAVNAWRKEQRERIRAERLALPPARRRELHGRILDHLEAGFPELTGATVGFYWPFRGEVDVLPLLKRHGAQGDDRAALPVVVQRNAPVEWWQWTPRTKMAPGIWNIPAPADRHLLHPSVLVVPLLGFDAQCYRLGNGGGYFDRTLATMEPRPLTLGIGYGLGRVDSIRPQPHDIPLDACITEDGWHWPAAAAGPGEPSSPVCYASEADPEYFGYLSESDARALLAEVRREAGIALTLAGALVTALGDADGGATAAVARCCALACGLLARAGAPPPPEPAPKPLPEGGAADAASTLAARLTGLASLAESARPRMADEAVHAWLGEVMTLMEQAAAALPEGVGATP